MSKTLLLVPHLSEKAYRLSKTEEGVYSFNVPRNANKHSVARAVAEQFSVEVKEVRILNQDGKAKRTVRKGGRSVAGSESDFKKAYVKIAAGQVIPMFASVDEETDKSKNKVKAK